MPNISLLAWGFILLGVLGFLGTATWRIYDAGRTEVYAEWERVNAAQREAEAKRAGGASAGLEKDRGKNRIVYRTITESVEKIVDRPVYSNICMDDDGLRLLTAAVRGEAADPAELDGAVSRLNSPGGR